MGKRENYRILSVREKKNHVREFIKGEYGSYALYARRHGLSDRFVARMVQQYRAEVEAEIESEKNKTSSFVTDEIPAESPSSHMIQISFIEYQELKHKELRYELILNTLQQCI